MDFDGIQGIMLLCAYKCKDIIRAIAFESTILPKNKKHIM